MNVACSKGRVENIFRREVVDEAERQLARVYAYLWNRFGGGPFDLLQEMQCGLDDLVPRIYANEPYLFSEKTADEIWKKAA
jgi:hypothetical protein